MIHGTFAPAFEPIADALAAQLRRPSSALAGGASVCVYHRGRPVVDIWGGTRDALGKPWEEDTIALSFSTTKGVLATLVHRLVDQGFLDLDDPVARYWPEFAQAGKHAITIRQLLSHHAGLHAIRPLIRDAAQMLDWRAMTEALAAAAPRKDSAGRSSYHAITYGWLVGELVRRVTQGTVNDALQAELGDALDLDGAFIGAPLAVRHRVATLLPPRAPGAGSPFGRAGFSVAAFALRSLWKLFGLNPAEFGNAMLPPGGGDIFFSQEVLDAEIPSANGVYSARSLSLIYSMLAGGGTLDGKRLRSAETLANATEVQSRKRDTVLGWPMRWRLGFHGVGTLRGMLPRAFGHFGYGGSGAWADPERDLAFAMTLNRIAGTPVADTRILRLGALAVQCAGRA